MTMTKATTCTPAVLALLLTVSAAGSATAEPSRLDAIAELLTGQTEVDSSQAPEAVPANPAGEAAASPATPAPLPPSALPLEAPPAGEAATIITGPATLADLADYVRARVPDTPVRDPLAEACALAATLNPSKPPHKICKAN
jgi:hypothetical protein